MRTSVCNVLLCNSKLVFNLKRSCRSRRENLANARAFAASGNTAASYECYQRAVDISPAVAKRFIEVSQRAWQLSYQHETFSSDCRSVYSAVIPCSCMPAKYPILAEDCDTGENLDHILFRLDLQALKAEGVEFIVAPYEADAQMTYLAISGRVHAVFTEDSDMLPYGCPKVKSIVRMRGVAFLASPCLYQ